MSKKLHLILRRKISNLQIQKKQMRIYKSLLMKNNCRRIVDRKKRSLIVRNQTISVKMINLTKRSQMSSKTNKTWKFQNRRKRRVFQRLKMRNINLSPILKIRDLRMSNLWRLISRLTRLVSSILTKIKWWLTRSQMMKMAQTKLKNSQIWKKMNQFEF